MKSGHEIIQSAVKEGRRALFEHEAKELARSVGIVVPKYTVMNATDAAGIQAAAENIGFPVAVKAVSTGIVHKTESGAVMLDIKNSRELAVAIDRIRNSVSHRAPGAVIWYFLIEKMMPPGLEFLIGGLRDAQFGTAVAFGLGGIWTEALKDVAFGVLPMTKDEMIEMMNETRAAAFFREFRGIEPIDRDAVLSVMTAVSSLMTDYPEIREIDLNPLRVYAGRAAALDVRVLLQH